MAIVISGVNNNDKITASDGTIDLLSGVNYGSEVTVPSFKVGSDIQFGNAGIITATTLVGNVTGNVNATSNLLLQIGGSEKFRVGSSGQLGIAGANYGTSGQVLTSGGSGSAATWSTITGTTINNNANNRLITGSGTANTLEGEAGLTYDGSALIVRGSDAVTGSGGTKTIDLRGGDANNEFVNLSFATGAGGPLAVISAKADATGVYPNTTGSLTFNTQVGGGIFERVRIASDGKIGINIAGSDNTSPVRNLDIADSSGAILRLISTDDSLGANERLGEIEFYSDDDDNAHIGAFVKAIADPSDAAGRRTALLFGTQNHDASVNAVEKFRIDCNGNIALGNSNAAKKVHISTTGNQKILIDPNYNNNSGGSSNSEADANNIVESILIRTSFGSNAASQTNAGHKWGIKFQGYNGNDFTQAISKCAGVFAVSEDEAGGYNRNVGLTFHTSPYNTAHREVMRINTNGIVTKPYQYVFLVETNGASKAANWSKVTGLTPDSSQCTGVSDGTYWSNSNQQFTAPVTGVYHFFVGGWASPSSNGTRYAYSFRHTNGNNLNYIGGGDYCTGDSPMAGFSRTIKLSAGEWVELWMYSAISATLGGGHRFFWGGYLLG